MIKDVDGFLDNLFANNPLNRLPDEYDGGRIFSKPLTGVSAGDDYIFAKYKEVVGPKHLTPAEMWAACGLSEPDDFPKNIRIVSIIFPYSTRIREASKSELVMPAEIYCVGRNFANSFMKDLLVQTVDYFKQKGFQAAAGMLSSEYQLFPRPEERHIYSSWSERHMAFAAGLGTFSLHEAFISKVGCNIRIASVLTDAPLDITPRTSDDPYANCLFFKNGSCRKCVKRCPGDAFDDDGHDKYLCRQYGVKVIEEMAPRLKHLLKPHTRNIEGTIVESFPVGCAFCQFDVPCMDKIPVKE